MKKNKKIFSIFLSFLLLCTTFSSSVFAEKNLLPLENRATANRNVNLKEINPENTPQLAAPQEFTNLEDITDGNTLQVPPNALDRRNVWRISESVFVSDETLDEVYDIWVVTLNDTMLSFLKLASSNPNLMAVLYYIDANGNLGNSSGWGVNANGSASPANIPPGQYAIVIGSTSGTETGTYTLMWNCSNPSKNAKRLLACSDDLTRIMVYYNDTENKTETILTSGEDILTNLTWQESETWVTSLGYSARDMVMKLTSAKGIYLGSLSTSEPYSVPNALFIEVNRGTWRYCNSYYENDAGAVVHRIDWYDLSGQKTPREFGTGPDDFSYGPSYIVIDLDKFEVGEFVSPFNYHYSIGGRTHTISNWTRIN